MENLGACRGRPWIYGMLGTDLIKQESTSEAVLFCHRITSSTFDPVESHRLGSVMCLIFRAGIKERGARKWRKIV